MMPTQNLYTTQTIAADLRALGIKAGMTLLVHSSLKALGWWVCGGAAAVILALEEALTPEGALVMPTFIFANSDPSGWKHPPVPEEWWQTIREQMPAYRPNLSPCPDMGRIADTFRKQAGVLRSAHPSQSFAAWGDGAEAISTGHKPGESLGEETPLAHLYERAAWVLLLGVGHNRNTSLHLAEYRAKWPGKRFKECGAAMLVDGERKWVTYTDLDLETHDFQQIGSAFAAETGLVRKGKVAGADCMLMPQRPLVDFGIAWMEKQSE